MRNRDNPFLMYTEGQLLEMLAFYADIAMGKRPTGTNVPGIGSNWKIPTMEESRVQQTLIGQALAEKNPQMFGRLRRISKTVMVPEPWSYQNDERGCP